MAISVRNVGPAEDRLKQAFLWGRKKLYREFWALPEVSCEVQRVTAVVNEADVDRARGRAALLQRAGYRALPVVAGERLTFAAEASARAQNVAILEDGRGSLWEEAVAAWGAA